jgi:3'-5' exoribonuclease 1
MNFIIFDLEATCWNGSAMGKVSEIIEIGAIRMNGFGEITGEYNRFVKPILNPRLSPYCRELTTIEQYNVDRAKKFDVVIEEFQDWIGHLDGEDYLLCSWGAFDRKMLIQDCILYDLEPEWAEEHIDLKGQYQQIRKLSKPHGLKKAIEKNGFEFEGIHHRAISDALNLSKIFKEYLDEWMY